jgi:hypothetical protein
MVGNSSSVTIRLEVVGKNYQFSAEICAIFLGATLEPE